VGSGLSFFQIIKKIGVGHSDNKKEKGKARPGPRRRQSRAHDHRRATPPSVFALLTIARAAPRADAAAQARLSRLIAVAIAVQAAHFAEELGTGFHLRFPAVLGLAPWSATFFVAFNLAWIAIWILSAAGVRRGVSAALVPLWFLALSMIANAVAHPVLALSAASYFPGLITAPIAGIAGLALAHQLLRVTDARGN
jgi:hypothetical protein